MQVAPLPAAPPPRALSSPQDLVLQLLQLPLASRNVEHKVVFLLLQLRPFPPHHDTQELGFQSLQTAAPLSLRHPPQPARFPDPRPSTSSPVKSATSLPPPTNPWVSLFLPRKPLGRECRRQGLPGGDPDALELSGERRTALTLADFRKTLQTLLVGRALSTLPLGPNPTQRSSSSPQAKEQWPPYLGEASTSAFPPPTGGSACPAGTAGSVPNAWAGLVSLFLPFFCYVQSDVGYELIVFALLHFWQAL